MNASNRLLFPFFFFFLLTCAKCKVHDWTALLLNSVLYVLSICFHFGVRSDGRGMSMEGANVLLLHIFICIVVLASGLWISW